MNLGLIPAKWAALTPRRTALIDIPHQRRIDWASLDARVRRLAHGLRALGLRSGDRVAVLSRNGIEYQELYFAVARAGLVLLPLNWRLSPEALRTLLTDAEPALLVASDEFRHVAADLGRAVDLKRLLHYGPTADGSYEDLIAASPDSEPPWCEQVQDTDPCFILYTGGTTGMAKGVVHSHRSVAAGMLNQTVAERVVPSDVYLLTGQMFHIPVVLSMNYLAHGCPVVLMNFEARQALEVIAQERVSAFLGITTMLSWMMATPGFGAQDLSSLRNIQYGGGPMPSAIVREVAEAFPCGLIQGYGQTEGATMSFLSQEDHRDALRGHHPHRLRSCGREGFGTRIRVVDADGHEVPRDGKTPGEIVVRGEANMLGYFRRPDLTAKTFQNGWMRTGDVATWDSERYLYIVDRLKDMIISGGEKIYSVEVEEAIGRHPAVLECAVIGVPDARWGESVKAFVVLKPHHTATAEDILAVTRDHLASYQKPRSVEFVAALPKAPTGKLLKRELRAPYWAEQESP
ncbi:AMP-binding protein [Archangium primigenium]|uniref:AMP-binding protein n=1 Tax=[Archangium] primigenium TaxID=2792470 RepID=UPI00195957B0|nr:AMP-binding protein [Archangium primigenium]MBM7112805.1 AMP-binding protein [Archangium primigenium]